MMHWLFKNVFNEKKIPKNENSCKVIDIVAEVLEFNKQQKVEGLKILTVKQTVKLSNCLSKAFA